MRLLVANANTNPAVTEAVVAEARHHAAAGTEIVGATGSFGVSIVSTEAENVVAGHAALDMLARHADGIDAAILAISMDTALAAAQELMPFPVVGMTAAALHTACLLGRRFGLVTFGESSRALYLALVREVGLAGRMVGCETIPLVSAAGYVGATGFDAAVLTAVVRLRAAGAASVVIAGAASAGMARRLQCDAPVPVLDGIACAVRQAELLVGLGIRPAGVVPLPKEKPPVGLSDALSRRLHPPA